MLKKISSFFLLFFHKALIAFAASGSVYNTLEHSVLLLGDLHCADQNRIEIDFKKQVAPYIKKLIESTNLYFAVEVSESELSSNIDYFLIYWAEHYKSIPQLLTFVQDKYSNYQKKDAHFLSIEEKRKASIIKEATKYFIQLIPLISHLGLLKQIDPAKNSYNKFKSCREACSYFNISNLSDRIILADWRSELMSEIIRIFRKGYLPFIAELKNHEIPESYLNELMITGYTDKILANDELNKKFFKALSKVIYDLSGYEYKTYKNHTVENLLQELEIIIDKLAYLESSSTSEEKNLWVNFKLEIQKIKNTILELQNDFKNLSIKDKKVFEELFQWSFKHNPHELHWSALLYCSLLKNNNLAESFNISGSHWLNIMVEDIADAGFIEAILESKKNRKNIVLYAGANHCKRVGEYLIRLGYHEFEYINNLNNDSPLTEIQLNSLVTKFLSKV